MTKLMLKDAAKILNVGSQTLFRKLKEKGVISRTSKLPRRELVTMGLFDVEIRHFEKGERGLRQLYSVTLVTERGLCYLRELLDEDTKKSTQPCSPEQQH